MLESRPETASSRRPFNRLYPELSSSILHLEYTIRCEYIAFSRKARHENQIKSSNAKPGP
jgi:hypothetical protein